MSRFNILLCEDNSTERNLVDAYIKNLRAKYPHLEILITTCDFESFSTKYIAGTFDICILDMYKDNERTGESILAILNANDPPTTIIYTLGSKPGYDVDYPSLFSKYHFIREKVIKGDRGDDLIKAIEKIINKVDANDYFELNDPDDIFLSAEVKAVGRENLNEILHRFQIKAGDHTRFTISRMSSGFSGAALFFLARNGKKIGVLKISKEKKSLSEEILRARVFYKKFPSRLRIDIDTNIEENDEVVATVLEEVNDALPLFNYIKLSSETKIEDLLSDLFLEGNSMKDHYLKVESDSFKFDHIFERFDNTKLALIKHSVKELRIITDEYANAGYNLDVVNDFLHSRTYRSLDKATLDIGIFGKSLPLCHGDLHAHNIMVQNDRPVLIDTGGIGYAYWTADIARLIVSLFVNGWDNSSHLFFDINQIPRWLTVAQSIIDSTPIPNDGVNDNFICAVNWLLLNAPEIYGPLYSGWELQLGLMKEFLQVAYRSTTVTHSKRALSLLAAHDCLIAAEKKLSIELSK